MTTPESSRIRVYTRAREPFLSYEVHAVDTILEPFRKSFDELLQQPGTGLWLKPYRGIPAIPGLPQLEIVYLDEDDRVIAEIDSYPSLDIKPLDARTASALVLPAHTVFASQVRAGDQLMFWPAGEADAMEHGPGWVSGADDRGLTAQSAGAGATGAQDGEAMARTASDDGLERLRRAIEEMEEAAASQSQKKESVTARLRRWVVPDPLSFRSRAMRVPMPDLVAYRGTGEERQSYCVGNISRTGLFLLTDERPAPGTRVAITLQRLNEAAQRPAEPIQVQSTVARWGVDGVGLAFVQWFYG